MPNINVKQVDPQVVWLRDEFGNKAFFPSPDNTEFEFSDEVGSTICSLLVEGVDRGHGLTAMSLKPHSTIPVASHSGVMPYSPLPGPSGVRTFNSHVKSKTCSARITKAFQKVMVNGKTDLLKLEQTFIDLTEETANVNFVNDAIQNRWGKEFVVCTSDGLPIEDSSGTTGM